MARNSVVFVLSLLVCTSLWAVDHDVSIASIAVGSSKPWQWTVFVKGTSDALAHVKCVQYVLDKTFPNPIRTICNRGAEDRAFASSGTAWGQFTLSATVAFDDGYTHPLGYTLNPQESSLPDVLSGRWKFNAKKSAPGGVQQYRNYSRVGDSIQVSIDGQVDYIIVCDGQVHRTNQQDISCSLTDTGFQGHQEPPSRYFVDEVNGNTLTISTYSDAARTKRVLMLVYEREVPVP
jgi:hypothetical protein